MPEQTAKRHDLFVSYAKADRAWEEGYLLDALKAEGVKTHSEETFHIFTFTSSKNWRQQ